LNNKKFIEKLKYFFLNINKNKQIINLIEKGILELYPNDKKKVFIKTKNGTLFKSDILFLIIPGGAYRGLGNTEKYPVVKKFYSLGYSTALLKYSVYPKKYPTNYNQGLKAIEILSTKFPKIILIGFSAGGHLAGMLGTTEREKLYNAIGMILCYPVISFVNNTHKPTRRNFLGKENENNTKFQKLYSIENRVNKDTLPTFIWTMKNDKVVPYQNTLYMIEKLKEKKVKFEYKIFEKGRHGISVADESVVRYGTKEYNNEEIAKWVELSCNFFESIIKNE
jgi:acetyl esterase/lipase